MISNLGNETWGNTDLKCMEYDSRLASIHNEEENAAITQELLYRGVDAWIGLEQNGSSRLNNKYTN